MTADQVISFSPPGTIGLPAEDAVVLLRFDELDPLQPIRDATGTLGDLVPGTWTHWDAGLGHDVITAMTMPEVVDAATGRGRRFSGIDAYSVSGTGLIGYDRVSGSSLLTRDVTIQAICTCDLASQAMASGTGTIIRRGGAYALSLYVVNAPARLVALRASGAPFALPDGFTLLTMTRRWVSPALVVSNYYCGDRLVDTLSTTPFIGGATIDPTFVGYGQAAGFDPFIGTIDELLVLDREITREEVEATWLRITKYQPLGYQLFKELHDPGFPMSTDPSSDVQLEARMWGHGMGYAAAMAEDMRANMLPPRAYGAVLAAWEQAVAVTPQPNQDVVTRRARVLARLRQRRGSSIDGLKDVLASVVGTDVDNLEFLAFDQTIREDFALGIRPERWDVQPSGVTAVSGAASFQPGAGTFTMTGTTRSWITMTTAVGGDGREAHLIAKLALTTPIAGVEAGVYFGDWPHGNYLLLGIGDVAGVFKIVTESFVGNVSQGLVVQATLGSNPAALWLHLYQLPASGSWLAAWSTTSAIAGFATSTTITHPTLQNLGGCYLRSTGAIAAPRADFDDVTLRAPYGDRSLAAYVYRDPGLPGTLDVDGAQSAIVAIKHAFIDGAIITSKSVVCDDPGSLCDHGPMGGF